MSDSSTDLSAIKLQIGEPFVDLKDNKNDLYIGTSDNVSVSDLTPINGKSLDAGDGIDITNEVISIKNSTSGGLVTDANGLKINLAASNPGLKISSNTLDTKISASGGLTTDSNGLKIKQATNSGLTINSDGVKIGAGTGISVSGNTVAVNMSGTAPISVSGNAISLGVNQANGLKVDNSNLAVDLAASGSAGGVPYMNPGTVKVNTNNGLTLTNGELNIGTIINSQYAQYIGTNTSHPGIGGTTQPVYIKSDGSFGAADSYTDARPSMLKKNSWNTYTVGNSLTQGIWVFRLQPNRVENWVNFFIAYYGDAVDSTAFDQDFGYEIEIGNNSKILGLNWRSPNNTTWRTLDVYTLKGMKIVEI